jgi:hypothetical protein
MDRRWKIIIFMTYLFTARKASLSSEVPSLCGRCVPDGSAPVGNNLKEGRMDGKIIIFMTHLFNVR